MPEYLVSIHFKAGANVMPAMSPGRAVQEADTAKEAAELVLAENDISKAQVIESIEVHLLAPGVTRFVMGVVPG